MRKNNYLIVGGNSFIGINLALGLLKQGQNVKVFSRHINNFPQNIVSEVEFIKGDLKNVEDIYKALVNIDIIIYLAATSNVATSIEDVFGDINSSLFFLNFMESVKDFRIKKIILASSGGTVYGEPEYLPIDEKHPLRPLSPYGITKVSLENYLYFYKRKYGINYVVCRYSNPYGKYQNPLKKVGAINCFLYQHLSNERIHIYGNPEEIIRDYIYIDDLVEITIQLAQLNQLKSCVYNIGSGKGLSLKRIIVELEKITERKVDFICYKQKQENVQKIILNIDKIKQELNWEPKIDFKHGIRLNKLWIEEFLYSKKQ
ncbi:NAD-dependent epimerase/dehydratase family protein [Bacillus cereus group sp. MYBK5-2]|uniref:NAD-dependent epimerase/dehydratase family protein n=1 Tax=Bacillus cereus group sp. MYBK5-2 TaxID=3450622 RepID=UPI003F7A36A6